MDASLWAVNGLPCLNKVLLYFTFFNTKVIRTSQKLIAYIVTYCLGLWDTSQDVDQTFWIQKLLFNMPAIPSSFALQ